MHTEHTHTHTTHFRQRRWSSRRCWWCFDMIWSTILPQLARSASQLSPKSRPTSRPTHWRCSPRRKWTWYVLTDLSCKTCDYTKHQCVTTTCTCTCIADTDMLVWKVVNVCTVYKFILTYISTRCLKHFIADLPLMKKLIHTLLDASDIALYCWPSIDEEAHTHIVRCIRYRTLLLTFHKGQDSLCVMYEPHTCMSLALMEAQQ